MVQMGEVAQVKGHIFSLSPKYWILDNKEVAS